MNDMNRIEPQIVNNAVSNIELALSALSSNYQAIDDVSKSLTNAWESENSAIVASKVNEVYNDLVVLKNSIDNIKNKVLQVSQATEKSDDVQISGGGSAGSGTSQQTSSQFSQSSVR